MRYSNSIIKAVDVLSPYLYVTVFPTQYAFLLWNFIFKTCAKKKLNCVANHCGYRSNRSCYLSVASYLTRLQLGTKSSHLCRQEAKSIQDVSVAWFYFWHSLGLDALSGRKLLQYEVTLADLHFTVLFMVRSWTWNNKQEKVWQRFTAEMWHWWSGLRGKDWLGHLPW